MRPAGARLAAAYDSLLAPLAPVVKPVTHTDCLPTLHLYPVLIDFEACGLTRADVMARLAELGIGTQVHYYPVHRQRYYADRYGTTELPGADRYYARALSLPFFASMTISDVGRVVDALKRVLRSLNRRKKGTAGDFRRPPLLFLKPQPTPRGGRRLPPSSESNGGRNAPAIARESYWNRDRMTCGA